MSELNEERPEWYERLRTDDAFPGRTFTPEAMDRIESLAGTRWSRPRSWRLRIGVVGAAACVIALAAWFAAAGPLGSGDNAVPSGLPEVTGPSEPVPTASSTTESHFVFQVKGNAEALAEPRSAAAAVFVAKPGEYYWIADTSGQDYAQIVAGNGAEGWVPVWYLTDDPNRAGSVERVAEPYVMLVDKPFKYRLYPGEETPSGFELWSGKVVQVVGIYGDDWLEIETLSYDSPHMENKWVRKDEVTPYDKSKAMEGYASSGAKLYDIDGNVKQTLSEGTSFFIKGDIGGRYWILLQGGVSGYIDKADFKPNPFAARETSGNAKYLKGDVMVHVGPGPNGSYSPFVALPSETYSIGETRDGYVQITDGAGQAGWIPEWYSTNEESGHRVSQFDDPYVMIVDKPVKYRMYPGEQTPSGFELWAGKVVQVVGRYEHWLEINVVTYDSPYMENKWVRDDELVPYEDNMANEGYLGFQDVPLYDENGKVTQKITPITTVYIEGEQGDRYRIIAAGGISGYIDKKDFVPNPFSIQFIDQ